MREVVRGVQVVASPVPVPIPEQTRTVEVVGVDRKGRVKEMGGLLRARVAREPRPNSLR